MITSDPRLNKKEWPKYRTIAERRQANQKNWAINPVNQLVRRAEEHNAKLDVQAEITSVLKGQPSLTKLRHIMASPDMPLHRRIEAAETIIGYELGPGAAAGIEPHELASDSYQFLRTVTETTDVPESLMFRALKAIASVENARAAIRDAGDTLTTKRQCLIDLVNAERRRWLAQHGRWPAGREPWFLDPTDTFNWPPGWPGMWMWPLPTIGSTYAKNTAASLTTFRSMLRSIRATNRDDQWEHTQRLQDA
jgi:hypothetical protein